MGWSRVRVLAALVVIVSAAACETGTTAPAETPATAPSTSCTGSTGGPPTTTSDIAYAAAPGVDSDLLSLDLTVPDRGGRCGPAPVVVWVHGGAFAIGDKAYGVADMRRWAIEQGWAFASVNHRLSPSPPSDAPNRVLHPTHVSDVAAAVGWLDDHAADRRLDPERFLLVGHSAGAFLVSLLGTDGRYLEAAGVELDQVRSVAVLDTRFDITAAISDGGRDAEAIYRNAFGDDPAVWRDASPLTHAGTGPSEPPFVVVTRGSAARVGDARAFADRLDEATVVDARPLSHAQVGDALGRPGDTVVTPPITAAFRRALDRPTATPR